MAKKFRPKWRKPMKESTNVKAYDHDGAKQTLYVEFHSGKKYSYANVDEAMYLKFINAESIGSFLSKNITNTPAAFPATRLN